MPSYAPVRSVEKALTLLEALNRRPVSRIRDLSAETGMPHSTIIRLLETLVGAGYARRVDRGAGYCVASRVGALSAGDHGFPAALEALRAEVEGLTRDLLWPASICTLDGDAMVVRCSTIPQSPLAHIHSTINRRLCLWRRAHGRAWLAFCPAEERAHLLAGIAAAPPGARDGFDAAALEAELEGVRAAGFALRAPALRDRTNSIAAPWFHRGRLTATLGLTFFAGAAPDPAPLARALMQAAEAARAAAERAETAAGG